jgi:hypothetical protein
MMVCAWPSCDCAIRGFDHSKNYRKIDSVKIAAVCDIDENVIVRRPGDMEKPGVPERRKGRLLRETVLAQLVEGKQPWRRGKQTNRTAKKVQTSTATWDRSGKLEPMPAELHGRPDRRRLRRPPLWLTAMHHQGIL